MTAACERCGGELPAGSAWDRRYCSKVCRNRSHDARRKAVRQAAWPADRTRRRDPTAESGPCPRCGRPVAQNENRTKSFCSRECKDAFRNRVRKAKTTEKQTAQTLVCANCRRPFPRPSRMGVPPRSCRACRTYWGGRRPDPTTTRPCAWCGVPFRRPAGQIGPWPKTCSPACRQLHYNARKAVDQAGRPRRANSDAERAKNRERARFNSAVRREAETAAGLRRLAEMAAGEGVPLE